MPGSEKSPSIFYTARRWWSDFAARDGAVAANGALLAVLWEFVRDSTPARLRQRYGDVDYDWDHRVNTTSAAVGWRDRLLGVFHSPYQPTEPALFHEMLTDLQRKTGLRFEDFTFIDLGSGKGRTLLMASDYPFRRILGVELLPALHEIAVENLRLYKNESQKCCCLKAVCGDASTFALPEEPLVIFLFNPFPEPGLRRAMESLEHSLRNHPRKVYVLYHNPLLEHVVLDCGFLDRIGGTHQYSIFRSREISAAGTVRFGSVIDGEAKK
jgi:SAM-dependent methyltransferase